MAARTRLAARPARLAARACTSKPEGAKGGLFSRLWEKNAAYRESSEAALEDSRSVLCASQACAYALATSHGHPRSAIVAGTTTCASMDQA